MISLKTTAVFASSDSFNDHDDQYLEYGTNGRSFTAFRSFRALIMNALQFPVEAEARQQKPLRVTI